MDDPKRASWPLEARGTTPMFTLVLPADEDPRARPVTVIAEAADGTLWCGTRKGLLRLEPADRGVRLVAVPVGQPEDHFEQKYVTDLLEDRFGTLWIATPSGLYRRWPDGTTARYTMRDGLPTEFLHDLLEDRAGGLWVASRAAGFFRVEADDTTRPPAVVEHYGFPDPLHTPWIFRLAQTSDGRFWLATNRGLVEVLDGRGAQRKTFRAYGRKNGLTHQERARSLDGAPVAIAQA